MARQRRKKIANTSVEQDTLTQSPAVQHTKDISPKEKKLFDNLLRVTQEFIKGKNFRPQSQESLRERLKIHEEHFDLFDKIISSLEKQGIVTVRDNTIYTVEEEEKEVIPSTLKTVRGQISVHHRGFGFVNMPAPGEDIFIPKPFMNGAIDGDIVEVEFDTEQKSEKGPDGKVVAIIERGRKNIAGTVMSVVDNTAFVYSSLLGETNLCRCPLSKKNSKIQRGDRVIIEVLSWGPKKQPESCRIHEIIGNIDDPLSDIPFAIAANGIRAEFPEKALVEARSYGTRVSTKEIQERRDLRDLECFTIDPDTAKDFDDAISLEKKGAHYRLGVHIADVSYYVRPGSTLDQEAQTRCNSTYFPGKCIPMIPHELSDNLCSLKPHVNRLTVSVFVDIDENGKTIGWDIARSVIKSQKRFTYKEAKKVLDGQKKSKHEPTMQLMVELCTLLQKERAERGSVQLSMPELVLKVDDKGIPTGTEVHEYDVTHQLVEEFMLKANEVVAIHLNKQGKDLTYRVHDEPAPENLRDFSSLVQAFGFDLPETPTAFDIQRFFVELQGSSHMQYLATSYIKSMRLACYSADNIGHYGLSLEHYCHFTSPIRRYVDTVVHRLLFGLSITKQELDEICLRSSERERISARAESSVLQMKKLRYLSKLMKDKPTTQYKALISKVKPYGIYFDIVDIMMDGFLHISELENDYFLFDDAKNILTGRHRGISYRAGDKIVVMPKTIDLITLETAWHMVGRDSEEESERSKKEKTSRKSSKKRSWKKKQ